MPRLNEDAALKMSDDQVDPAEERAIPSDAPAYFEKSIDDICEEEGVSATGIKRCIRKAKDRVARRLYILTEIDRLTKLFDGEVSEEDIDDLVAENLANLIYSGQFGTHFEETMLS